MFSAMSGRKQRRGIRQRRRILHRLIRRRRFSRRNSSKNHFRLQIKGMLCKDFQNWRTKRQIRRRIQMDRRTDRNFRTKNVLQRSSNWSTFVRRRFRSTEVQQTDLQSRQLLRDELRVLRPPPGIHFWK